MSGSPKFKKSDFRQPLWLVEVLLLVATAGLFAGVLLLFSNLRALGVAFVMIATFAAIAAHLARRERGIRHEMTWLIESIDRISQGHLDADPAENKRPEEGPMRNAVDVITQRMRQAIEGLHEVAHRDALTNLFNRASFERNVELQLKNEAGLSAFLFIDIDGFKSVNDTLGHNFGDRLLQVAAERLKLASRLDEFVADEDGVTNVLPPKVSLARFGGDEFTVFLSNITDEAVARKIAARILRVISEPYELAANMASVSASIGIAYAGKDGSTYSELLRAADTAMYHAKRSGRSRVEVYTSALDDEARRIAEEEQELREALSRGEFELHYQPLFDCRSLRISSAEALLRWRHPRRGIVMPSDFIPLAERSNLINAIGEWVAGEAVRRIGEFAAAGRPLRISINVSPHQLETVEFIAMVKASLQRWDAPPRLLELEITEDVAMRDVDLAADRLARISRLGVSIAIDDFGTGYSNLASLIRLPFTRLKIDRSLLQDLMVRPDARVLVQTIISMANSLGFHSVAEGVETREQLDLLTVMGCDAVQGYLLSRPISHEQLVKLLNETDTHESLNTKSTIAA